MNILIAKLRLNIALHTIEIGIYESTKAIKYCHVHVNVEKLKNSFRHF